MAKRKQDRLSKEELRAPDEIEVALRNFWTKVYDKRKLIIAVVGGLVLFGVALGVMNWMSSSSADTRAEAMSQATAALGAPVGDEAKNLPEPPAPQLASFTSRDEALAAAEAGLTKFSSEFSGDDSAELVDLALANVKLSKGDHAGAIGAVDAWLGANAESPAKTIALELKARAQLQGGDKAAAVATYQSVADAATGPLKVEALTRVGDLLSPHYGPGGDAAKAIAAYTEALGLLGPKKTLDGIAGLLAGAGSHGALENKLALLGK